MNATVLNITNIEKDEQNGKMSFEVNGYKIETDARGDGLYIGRGTRIESQVCNYAQFSVRGMDARNSKFYLLEWAQNSSVLQDLFI